MGVVTEQFINTPEGIQAYLQGTVRFPGVRLIRASNGGQQMAVQMDGVVRGGSNNGEDRGIALNEFNEQFVAQGLPPYAEMARLGGGFSAIQTAATAGLVVRPSTVAAITLWNGEGSGGKSYVIDRLFSHNLVSTAAESFFGIWATIHPIGMTDPGVDIARSATNITGNTGKTYNGMGVVGVAETVVNNGWYPWGSGKAISASGVIPGSHAEALVDGRLIVPPQGGISVQIVASLVGCTFTSGLSWYEVQLALN